MPKPVSVNLVQPRVRPSFGDLFTRTPGVELDFLKVFHRFGPKALKTVGKSLRQFFVEDQERCESAFGNKRMVEAEDDDVIVDDVKRMPNLSRITDTRNVFEMSAVFAEKSNQSRSRQGISSSRRR
jgi:hypothetical protein